MSEKFENPFFVVDLENLPACRVTVKLTVKPEMANQLYKKAVKQINKQISIPGFRKGKAPDSTVISRYSSYVEGEWKDLLIQEGVRGAFDLTEIYPVSKELLEKPKLSSYDREAGAVITFAYERYPQVPEIDFVKIQLPAIQANEISDAQIDEVLQEVRKAHADYEIVDKAIEMGDYADITVTNLSTQTPLVEHRLICADEKQVTKWLFDLLLGMKADEVKEGEAEGATTLPISVTVHSVKKSVLPEVNEALAKKVGASSVDDLMSKIRSNLEKEAEVEKEHKQMKALEDALLELYSFEIPASMLQTEQELRLKRRLQELKRTENDDSIRQQEDQIAAEVTQKAERGLRLYFLNRQMIKQGNIKLTQEEINKELVHQMMTNPRAFNQELDKAASERLISEVSALLIERKIKEYALSAVLTN